jgi:hypothetical protein
LLLTLMKYTLYPDDYDDDDLSYQNIAGENYKGNKYMPYYT